MADERFDLSYRGLIAAGADPEETRRRLTAVFKLTDEGVERLFNGKPVIVKRNVDAAAAVRFEKVFSQAGAVLTLTPVEGLGEGQRSGLIDSSRLALAPRGGVLEEPRPSESAEIDVSYLALVPGEDWTLDDCEPLPTPIPEPDMSYLALEPLDPAVAERNMGDMDAGSDGTYGV